MKASIRLFLCSLLFVGFTVFSPPEMIFVEGGVFDFGYAFKGKYNYSGGEVEISSFFLGKYEVTNKEFVEFLNNVEVVESEWGYLMLGQALLYDLEDANPLPGWEDRINYENGQFLVLSGFEDHPVTMVSWFGAVYFCNWLSEQNGYIPAYSFLIPENPKHSPTVSVDWSANGYRLPTEAEWEYAATDKGERLEHIWGDGDPHANIADQAVKDSFPESRTYWRGYRDGYVFTSPVGTFEQGSLGLTDLIGNVEEWCWDGFIPYTYEKPKRQNPRGPDARHFRSIRGRSFRDGAKYHLRTAYSTQLIAKGSQYGLGFRLARSYEE